MRNRQRPRARNAAPTALAALGLSLWGGCGAEPFAGPELPLLYVGSVWGGNLAVADGRVYFTTFYHGPEEDQAVWSMPAAGGEPSLVWHGAAHQVFGYGMAVHDGEVFWSQQDGDTPAVFSAPIGGGERTLLGRFTESQAPYTSITVDDDWIFAGSWHQIVRIPRRGGATAVVYTGRVQWLDRQGGPLYFVGDGVLVRVEPGAGAVSPVARVAGATHVELAGNVAYVAAADAVWTVPLTGGQPARTLTGLGEVEGILAGDGELWVATHEDGPHSVVRVPLATGTPEPVFHTRASEPSMVLADGALFLAFCCEELDSISGGQVVRLEL